MNTTTYDVAVVGVGVTGAATAWRLAQRGARVVALDRFAPPHAFGSSHGRTRIIREAYFEGGAYIPLVREAYDAWRVLEREHGRALFRRTGGLTLAPEGRGIAAAARRAATAHDVEIEILSGLEVMRRFPAFQVRDDDVGVWEPHAGVLLVDRCMEALVEAAREAGARLAFGRVVESWSDEGEGLRIRTRQGETILAGRLVLAVGSWMARLLPGTRVPLEVERSVVHWFEPAVPTLDPLELPVFIEELEGGRLWYGIPEEGLLKAGYHHGGELTDVDALRREVAGHEVQTVRQLLHSLVPAAAGACRASEVCPYTNTPDGDFLLDLHPRDPRVVIASACSGHGFKFGPVTGDLIAELALEGRSERVPASFRWRWT